MKKLSTLTTAIILAISAATAGSASKKNAKDKPSVAAEQHQTTENKSTETAQLKSTDMKQNILTKFLSIAILSLIAAFAANAQTDLKGRYIYEGKEGEDSFNFTLKFEGRDAVYYSYAYNGYGTLEGKWSAENGVITIVIPNGDLQLMFKFKQEGDDLEVIETLHHSIVDAGAVFKKDDSKPTGAELKPEEIGQKVVKLIKSIKTAEDLSSANLEKQIGMESSFNERNPKEFGVGGNVTGAPDWTYGFGSVSGNYDGVEKIRRLDFSFNYQLHEPFNPDMTTVCKAFDFNSLLKELKADGFSAPQPNYGSHSRVNGWSFTRSKVSVSVGVKGGWEPNIDNCVDLVLITVRD